MTDSYFAITALLTTSQEVNDFMNETPKERARSRNEYEIRDIMQGTEAANTHIDR